MLCIYMEAFWSDAIRIKHRSIKTGIHCTLALIFDHLVLFQVKTASIGVSVALCPSSAQRAQSVLSLSPKQFTGITPPQMLTSPIVLVLILKGANPMPQMYGGVAIANRLVISMSANRGQQVIAPIHHLCSPLSTPVIVQVSTPSWVSLMQNHIERYR